MQGLFLKSSLRVKSLPEVEGKVKSGDCAPTATEIKYYIKMKFNLNINTRF